MTQPSLYGPHNPHPLSQMRTELVWEGKYDEYGQRREVDIAGCAMPMQKIEGIDEPRLEAAANQQLTLFEQQNPRVDDLSPAEMLRERNRLVWGDNKLVMASLLQEFKGKVDLVAVLTVEAVYRSSTSQTIPPSPHSKGGSNPKIPLRKGDLGGSLRTVNLKLTQFLPSLAEVPSKELETIRERAIRSGFDFIDFWAIDFNWQPDKPFTHDWQDYRTRKDRSLKTISDAAYTYPAPGKSIASVKVVNTFSSDTSITIEVEV